MNLIYGVFIGAFAGLCAGIFGIGGGIVIIPLLIFVMKFTQQAATGTSLIALLLPVGSLGAWQYYKSGFIAAPEIKFGLLISLGMIVGTWLGARISVGLDAKTLSRMFSIFLILVAIRVWFK